ncbi:MAG: hypothetical protein Q4D33_13865, partial [Prevotellaceae bacterium]|nr:hypothetical protein [Prevotellaceae bacterium]
MFRHLTSYIILLTAYILLACSGPSIPENAQQVNKLPAIFPDYTEVTLPANLCAPNFMVKGASQVVARFSVGDKQYVYGEDNKVIIDDDEWNDMRDAAKGKSIKVEVFCNYSDNADEW